MSTMDVTPKQEQKETITKSYTTCSLAQPSALFFKSPLQRTWEWGLSGRPSAL